MSDCPVCDMPAPWHQVGCPRSPVCAAEDEAWETAAMLNRLRRAEPSASPRTVARTLSEEAA